MDVWTANRWPRKRVYENTVSAESTLKKKHHAIVYRRCRKAVEAETVRVAKESTKTNLSDMFTTLLTQPRREELLDMHLLKVEVMCRQDTFIRGDRTNTAVLQIGVLYDRRLVLKGTMYQGYLVSYLVRYNCTEAQNYMCIS